MIACLLKHNTLQHNTLHTTAQHTAHCRGRGGACELAFGMRPRRHPRAADTGRHALLGQVERARFYWKVPVFDRRAPLPPPQDVTLSSIKSKLSMPKAAKLVAAPVADARRRAGAVPTGLTREQLLDSQVIRIPTVF